LQREETPGSMDYTTIVMELATWLGQAHTCSSSISLYADCLYWFNREQNKTVLRPDFDLGMVR
jgi:hypothetical protein